jgi:hypothetical protein
MCVDLTEIIQSLSTYQQGKFRELTVVPKERLVKFQNTRYKIRLATIASLKANTQFLVVHQLMVLDQHMSRRRYQYCRRSRGSQYSVQGGR